MFGALCAAADRGADVCAHGSAQRRAHREPDELADRRADDALADHDRRAVVCADAHTDSRPDGVADCRAVAAPDGVAHGTPDPFSHECAERAPVALADCQPHRAPDASADA